MNFLSSSENENKWMKIGCETFECKTLDVESGLIGNEPNFYVNNLYNIGTPYPYTINNLKEPMLKFHTNFGGNPKNDLELYTNGDFTGIRILKTGVYELCASVKFASTSNAEYVALAVIANQPQQQDVQDRIFDVVTDRIYSPSVSGLIQITNVPANVTLESFISEQFSKTLNVSGWNLSARRLGNLP